MIKRLLIFALACGTVLGSWAFWFEPASLKNKNHEIALASWPAPCDGLRVAVLADLHVDSPFNGADKVKRIVDLTRAAKPDLILLAGDYVVHRVLGGTFVSPEAIAEGLRALSAPLGVFAVLGNHDRWLNARQIEDAFKAVGIKFLEDDAVSMTSGNCSFWLVGLSDFWEEPHRYKAALAKPPHGAPVIVFTHKPDLFPQIPNTVAITFAGHTHGGQVYFPMVGRLIVPSRYGERYAIGHIVENGRTCLSVLESGPASCPCVFLVPPEISLVTLRTSAASHRDHGRST